MSERRGSQGWIVSGRTHRHCMRLVKEEDTHSKLVGVITDEESVGFNHTFVFTGP